MKLQIKLIECLHPISFPTPTRFSLLKQMVIYVLMTPNVPISPNLSISPTFFGKKILRIWALSLCDYHNFYLSYQFVSIYFLGFFSTHEAEHLNVFDIFCSHKFRKVKKKVETFFFTLMLFGNKVS